MAGLKLHTSNELERLADALASVVAAPLASPFQPETIVVQSLGMARWLKLELARRHGVCANVRFPFPRAFEREVLAAVLPQRGLDPLFEPGALLWKIMQRLPAMLAQPGFDGPRHYLAGEPDPRKRFQLAQRIAGLFDQYLIYRPRMIAEWDAGRDDDWQAQLWREVSRGRTHPAALRRELDARLHQPGAANTGLPQRVSLFGIAALPPFHVELFTALARHVDVHLFLLQPCREWWGEIVSPRREGQLLRQRDGDAVSAPLHLERGHRLLASLGKQGQDFLKLVYEPDAVEALADWGESQPATLLTWLQSDILNLNDRGQDDEAKAVISRDDDSIQVHSCHSPLRELEVLHDHLLDWFARDPALEPRDVLVMMPDLEDYAPFVEAVFGAPEHEARRIPFTVADRGARRCSQLVDTFLALLGLPGSRFGAASVLSLLDAPAVRARFGLSEADLDLARGWVEQVCIRWGVDAQQRGRFDLPEFTGNTWREGLDRLLLGYALAGDEQLFQDRLPHDGIEGSAAATLGRFTEFVERLFAACELLEQIRPLAAWAAELRAVLDQFFLPGADAESDAQAIRDALAELARQARHAQFTEPVPLAVVLEQLVPALEEDRSGAGFLSGGVTFCALKPMRSIPFKVICLVGLSDNTFPRPTPQFGFDLMAQRPQAGDSSRREDDRYLFLETLLSARQRLYLSYVGQSVRDNSEAPPSVLVSELLDCLAQGFMLEKEATSPVSAASSNEPSTGEHEEARLRAHLVTRHRLQAFSEQYFTGGRLFSYSDENRDAANALRVRDVVAPAFASAPLAPPEPPTRELSLEQLVEFLANPAKFFAVRRLGIKLPAERAALEEREPFEITGLEEYSLKQELLEVKLAGLPLESARALATAAGRLPIGVVGEVSHRSVCAQVEAFHARLAPHLPAAWPEPLDVALEVNGVRVMGRFARVTPAGPIHFRCAKVKAKDLLRAWVYHLAWHAAHPDGHASKSLLIAEEESFEFKPARNASELLGELVALYQRGLCEPLKFFPQSSLAFAEAELRPATSRATKSPLDCALGKWNPPEFGAGQSESEDPFFDLCFHHVDPFAGEEFGAMARAVFQPLLAHRVEIKTQP